MKNLFKRLLSLAMALLMTFSVAVTSSAASVGKVKSLQAVSSDDDEINIKWKKVSGADGYSVYLYTSKGWRYEGSTKKTKFEVDNLSSAKTYKIKVRAYKLRGSKKSYGAYSSVLKAATEPDEVNKVKKSSSTKKSVTIKWAAEPRATGYQVYVYSSSKGKYVRKATTSSTKAKINLSKSGTTYKFKVRAYYKANSKTYYGEFSDVLKAKTSGTSSSSSSSSTIISASKAKSIALKHAGLTSSQIRSYECELDRENGLRVYEISFERGSYEYEYEINAQTGKILRSHRERD